MLVQVVLVLELVSEVSGRSSRRYNRRKYGRKYPRSYGRRHKHHHKHHYEYYEPSYEKVHETSYEPHHDEEVLYEDELEYEEGERVGWTSGTQYGGLDLAAALGLTGVGYVANSGGALHIVGRR